jgi:holliday junction DNA helicase RuvA
MIATLEGEVIGLGEHTVVVAVGGIGLQATIPAPMHSALRLRDHIFLYTHLIVRQDLLALYGFETEQDRHFFTLLLGVDGVGPRLAVGVLSTLSVDAIRRAVASEQAEIFSRVPGVGKRTAQKILLHLQDKIKDQGALEMAAMVSGGVDESVLEALTSLGYSVVEAQSALQSIPRDAPEEIEERLRIALQYFSG